MYEEKFTQGTRNCYLNCCIIFGLGYFIVNMIFFVRIMKRIQEYNVEETYGSSVRALIQISENINSKPI